MVYPHRRFTALLAVAAVLFAVQGCSLFESYPPQPTERLQPTTVKVVTQAARVGDHFVYTFSDGSTFDVPRNPSGYKELNAVQPGGLFLGSAKFQYGLGPLGDIPGCWQAMAGGNSDSIVWDLGDSILFDDGLELAKAPDYYADPEPKSVSGQLTWIKPIGDAVVPWMAFCSNDEGKIEWAKSDISKPRP